MAGIAWDKIIGAAAQSTLGILSLGILLVGVLAYLFFGKSDDRVKLWVFAGIFLAVIGLGVSILRESQDAGVVSSPGTPTSTPAAESPSPAPSAATPTSAPSDVANVDVSGAWTDTDGFTYRFSMAGNHVSYLQTSTKDGVKAGSGSGTISGRDLLYTYVDDQTGGSGRCSAKVSPDGGSIDGTCSSGGSSWGFRITRAS